MFPAVFVAGVAHFCISVYETFENVKGSLSETDKHDIFMAPGYVVSCSGGTCHE